MLVIFVCNLLSSTVTVIRHCLNAHFLIIYMTALIRKIL